MRASSRYNGQPKSSLRVYRIWQCMKKRCYNQNDENYYLYGGNGVKVCDEWLDSDKFIQWALANGYNDTLEIDRIDPEKDYEPDNCRWVTKKENASRKRKRGTAKYSDIKRAHKVWEYCKSTGINMSDFPEPLYPWQKEWT